MSSTRPRRGLAAAAAACLALTGLAVWAVIDGGEDLPPGPAGRVAEKDQGSHKFGKTTSTDYYLTLRTKGGTLVEFKASHRHFGRCYRNSAYPACTQRSDRDSWFG